MRGVHDLNISDKHAALVPVAGNIRLGTIGIGCIPEGNAQVPAASGTQLGDIAESLGLLVGEQLPATFKLIFPHSGPFGDREVIPTLKNLVDDFMRIIDAFATLCLGTLSS
jgi:hypothetical protein